MIKRWSWLVFFILIQANKSNKFANIAANLSNMSMKFSADKVFIDGTWKENTVIVTDDQGTILNIGIADAHDPITVQKVKGALLPGFVNTHCHLELSHMKAKVDTGTGLIPFIKNVVTRRDIAQEEIMQAIAKADDEMYRNGIVAVGDISNKVDTALIKSKSKLSYYTFVEMFDFMQSSLTTSTIDQYLKVFEQQSDHQFNKKSLVPHAPYSVSPALFDYINEHNADRATISIHNQETLAENDLFVNGKSDFIKFYEGFGLKMDNFRPIGKSSIYYTLQHLSARFKTIFVHNTLTKREDVLAAISWNDKVFWATCPNANLFIENRLPDYQVFLDTAANVTIGTDSLTSNWQLSIWEEIKTIKKYQSFIPLETIITWATLNGAKALGYDDRLGNFDVGKTPGMVHVAGNMQDISSTTITRLM